MSFLMLLLCNVAVNVRVGLGELIRLLVATAQLLAWLWEALEYLWDLLNL